jgi:hypothetical protein
MIKPLEAIHKMFSVRLSEERKSDDVSKRFQEKINPHPKIDILAPQRQIYPVTDYVVMPDWRAHWI